MAFLTYTTLYKIFLVVAILFIVILVREIIKYEPDEYKYRFYNSFKQKGWFDKKLDLSAIKADSTFILLTLGQSNAGNYGNSKYQPRFNTQVYNYSAGNLYYAKDPLIGCGGHHGSVWGRLADLLIENKRCKKVVIIPIAVGGTSVSDWATGYCNTKLVNTLQHLKAHNIMATHVLWHQGEADNGATSTLDYKKGMTAILNTIRKNGQTAPFYVSLASFTPYSIHPDGMDTAIRNAQTDFISAHNDVFTGPDTDKLVSAIHRFDAQHFSETGLKEFAKEWLKCLRTPQ